MDASVGKLRLKALREIRTGIGFKVANPGLIAGDADAGPSAPLSIQGANPRRPRKYHRGWRAPAQEKIDKPTGTFLRPRSDIAPLELLA